MKEKIPKSLFLNGTENNGYRHRYSCEKNEKFKKGFFELMENLGFDKNNVDRFVMSRYIYDEEEGRETKKIWIRKVKEVKDECWFFENKKYEIDVFFGVKKIIILIRIKGRKKQEKRREMLDNLENKSDWISEEEKEKRLRENNEFLSKSIKEKI